MRIAILSDIHGNLEALQKVLADVDASKVDEIACLGDCIGYGPDPEAVIAEILKRRIPTIIGNHEMAVCDATHLQWFNPMARRSLETTLTMLSADSIAYIKQLPYSLVTHGCRCVHGFPPDSAQQYLFQKSTHELKQAFAAMVEPICFIGHTHDLEIIRHDGRNLKRGPLREGITHLVPGDRYLINVGSVGQPRDGTNHAKYVILDKDRAHVETRFIPYDIRLTAARIKAAGLPETHARRLW